MSRKVILTSIVVIALIMVGRPMTAMSAFPDVTVYFDVTKPDFSIITTLTDPGGGNPSITTAECSMVGSGYTSGSIEGAINSETGWTWLSGTYFGSEIDLSSTFQVQAQRTNDGTNSTFLTTQTVAAEGIGPLEFSPTGDLVSGFYVYGEAGACSVTDTWALGLGQTFEGTADSITATAENLFERYDSFGSPIGDPVTNQFTVDTTGGDSFVGSGEGGSYETVLDNQSQPGFGFAASNFQIEVKDSSSPINLEVLFHTDQIVGETTTWSEHPDYPSSP